MTSNVGGGQGPNDLVTPFESQILLQNWQLLARYSTRCSHMSKHIPLFPVRQTRTQGMLKMKDSKLFSKLTEAICVIRGEPSLLLSVAVCNVIQDRWRYNIGVVAFQEMADHWIDLAMIISPM